MKKARSSSDEGQSSFILNKKPIPDVTLIVHEKSLDKNLLVRIVQECCTPYFYHKFIIGNIGTYSKKYILKVISNFVYPASFRALHYTVIKNKAVFLSRNCQELLLKICSENFRITNPEFPDNPFEVIILANFILYEEVQMEDDSQSILDVLKKRFKNETETIDLSEFSEDEGLTDYYPLFQMKFMLAVTSTIAEFSPKHLNLQNNCIRDISNLYPLKDFIESIDLCNNMIEDMSALMPLINFKTLKNLSLSGNPFCEKYNNYNYVLDVKRYCQNLEKLDGFDVTIPVFQKNLFCTSDAIDLVKNFIEHFFTVYDSNNRGNLIDLYDKDALFSVTAKIVPNQKNSSSAQLDHYGLKIPYVMCGATEIMKLFKTFPKTYHDPYPPVCDVTLFTDTHVSLVIGGVLKELQQILSFTRHFIFKRSDDRYVITNDQYHVSNALDFQTGWSFGFPMHLAISGNPLPYFQEEYRELEEVVHKITNMNYEYSQKYLDYCQYDLKKTLHLFSQLHVRGDVPENAFTPKSATPQQFQQGVLPYSEKMRKLVYKKHKSINLKTIWETLHSERMRALPGKPRTTDPTIKKIYRNVIIPSIDDNPKAPVDSYIPAPKKANHKPVSFNIQVPIINNEKPVQMVKPATKAVADPLVELAEKLAKHKELAAKKANELRQSLVSSSGPSPVNRAAAAVPSMVPPPNQSPNPNVGVNSTAANFTPGSILGPGPSFTSAMGNPFLPGQPLLGDPGMIHHGLQPHMGPAQFQMHAQQRFPMQHQFPVSLGNLQSAPRPLFPIPQGNYQSVIEVSKVTVGTVAKPAGNAVGSNTAPAVARPRGATPSLTGVALMPRGLGVGSQFGQLRAPVSVPNAAGSNLRPSGVLLGVLNNKIGKRAFRTRQRCLSKRRKLMAAGYENLDTNTEQESDLTDCSDENISDDDNEQSPAEKGIYNSSKERNENTSNDLDLEMSSEVSQQYMTTDLLEISDSDSTIKVAKKINIKFNRISKSATDRRDYEYSKPSMQQYSEEDGVKPPLTIVKKIDIKLNRISKSVSDPRDEEGKETPQQQCSNKNGSERLPQNIIPEVQQGDVSDVVMKTNRRPSHSKRQRLFIKRLKLANKNLDLNTVKESELTDCPHENSSDVNKIIDKKSEQHEDVDNGQSPVRKGRYNPSKKQRLLRRQLAMAKNLEANTLDKSELIEGLSTRIESGGKNNTSGRIPSQNSHEGCKNPRRGRSKDARSRRSRSKSRSRSSSISRSRKKRSSSRNRNRRSRDMSNRSRSRGRDCSKRSRSRSKDRSKRSRSRSKNRRTKRSRSRSKDRSKRSRSRSKNRRTKRSRSRSKDRKKRSRSRSKDKKKRSRSRSKDRKKRSRSRSKDGPTRSRSRSKDGPQRSRSRSKDRPNRSRSHSKYGPQRSRSRSKDGPKRNRSRSKDKVEPSKSDGSSPSKTTSNKNVISRIIRRTDAEKGSPRSENEEGGSEIDINATSTSYPSTSGKKKIKIAYRYRLDKIFPRETTNDTSSLVIERPPSGAVVSVSTAKNVTTGSGPSISNIRTDEEYVLSLAERKRRLDIKIQLGLQKIRKLSALRQSASNENEKNESANEVCSANNDAFCVKEGAAKEDTANKIADESSLDISHEKHIADVEESLAVIQKNSESTDETIETEKNTPPEIGLEESEVNLKLGKMESISIGHMVEAKLFKTLSKNDSEGLVVSLMKISSTDNKNVETSSDNVHTSKSEYMTIGVTLDDNKNAEQTSSDNVQTSKPEYMTVGVTLDDDKKAEQTSSDNVQTSKPEYMTVGVTLDDNKNAEQTSSDNMQTSKPEYMTVGVSLDDNKNAEENSSDNVKIPKSDVLGVGVYIDDNKNAEINIGNVRHQKSEVLPVEVSLDGSKKAETISDTLNTPKSEVVSVKVSLDNTKNAETISDNLKTLKSEGVSVGVTLGDTQNAETISNNLKTPKSEVLAVGVHLDGTKNAETISDNVKTIEEDLKPSHAGGVTVEVYADLKIPKSEGGYEFGKKEMEMDSTENMKSTTKMVILSTTPVPDNISEKSSNMKDHPLIISSNSDKHGKSNSRGEKGFSVNKYIEKSISSKTINQTDEQTTFGELDMTEKIEKEVCQSANISSIENLVQTPNFAEVKVQIPTSVEPFEEINKKKILTESHAVNETIKPASDVSSSVIITVENSGTYEIPETPSEGCTAVDSVDNNIANIDADKLKRAGEDESAIKASPINCSQKAIEGNVDTPKLTVEVVQPCDQERDEDIEDNNLDRTPDFKEKLNANILSEKISENTTTNSTDVGGKKSEDERTTKNLTDEMFLDVCTRKKSVDESTYAIDKIVQLADGMISASTTKLVSTDGNEFDNSEKQNETIIGTNKQVAEIMKTLAESNGKHVENAENEEKEISDGSHNVGKAKTDPIDPDRSVDENKKLAADYSKKLIVQLRNVAIEIDSTIKKKLPTEKSATIRDDHQPEEPKQMKIHLDEISIAKKLKTNKHLTINLVRMSLGVKFNHEEMEEEGNEIKKKMQSEIERRIPTERRPVKTLEMNSSSYRKKYLAEIDTKPQSRESSEEPILIVEDIPLVQVESSDEETQIKQAFQRTDEKLHNLAISNIFSLAEEVPSTSHNTEKVIGLDKQAPSSSHEMNDKNVTKDTDSIMRKDSPILLTISSDEEDTSHDKFCFSVDDSDDGEPEYVSLEDILGAK